MIGSYPASGKPWPSSVKPMLAFHGAPLGIILTDRMPNLASALTFPG